MDYNNEIIAGLKDGEKYTLVTTTDFGITARLEITLKGQKILPGYAQYKNVLEFIVQPRGKRKMYLKKICNSTAIFEGWDVPIKLDSEQTGSYSMMGNCLINVLGTTEQDADRIRQIFNTNKNPNFRKGMVLMSTPSEGVRSDKVVETVLFREEAKALGHGVLDRKLGVDLNGEE